MLVLDNIALSTLYAEWGLILFTTFMQFSAGTAFFACLLALVSEGLEAGLQEAIEEREVKKKLWRASFVLLVLSFVLSSFHLQNPFAALFNVENFSLSALNKESICVGIFALLLFIQFFKAFKILGFLAVITGLICVYVLGASYISDNSLSIWNKLGTMSAFYGTVFVLGSAFSLWLGRNLHTSYFKRYAAIALVLGFIASIWAKASWIIVFVQEGFVFENIEFTQGIYTLSLQSILAIFGLLCLLPERNSKYQIVLALGMLCFLFAELASRTIFFLTQIKMAS